MARGALAALKFSVWGLIGLGLLILAAIGAVIAAIEIALGK